ncbi:DUF1642 domain-containing protein [Lactococcus lactis subsp. lactis]|uniref:DUF1642 domain-containing protein n=1 Tax=Lactococcus lactis TaxID=1358 RepID=UPI00223C2F07|nr:DUF1642 domain-containing protein [Lactococcus lactis]MCT0056786.1 DUF1642 domain-containing protein [Lactococcus lactis subsp. lactis]
MTKFEEEVKRPKKAYIDPFSKRDVDFTGVAKKFTEGAQTLKEWKEYAFVLEDKLKLQQQALPVVPECVAKWIECVKKDELFNALGLLDNDNMPKDVNEWLFLQSNDDNINLILRAWLDGYTVEKPQLFYLRDELTGQFLAKDNQFKDRDRYFFWTGEDPLTHSIGTAWKLSFTQQEIDSMQTGSYELVPVEDGE